LPRTELVFFKENDGSVPLVEWLDGLQVKAREKCFVRLERLEELGHELRRPEAENLGEGIYELRAKHNGVNYRMLYFFRGSTAVIVTHGFAKQQAEVPPGEIRLATRRKRTFEANPAMHSFKGSS
jgi:phage-related protein